jgi:hypothetical protein
MPLQRSTKSFPTNPLLAIVISFFFLALPGCTTKMSDAERQNVAVAYSEMLIVKNIHRVDSAAGAKAADSVVRHYGFAGEEELMSTIKELGKDPDNLRTMIDSAQKRLERVQQGIDPDLPPAKPAPATVPPKK